MTPAQLERIAPFAAPPLVPEIKVAGHPTDTTFEAFRTGASKFLSQSTPYWAVSWPGGQALARYLLDHPEVVSGRDVIDLGCGNGLVAAAAAMANAKSVTAIDLDVDALFATNIAARRTGVRVTTQHGDFGAIEPPSDALICAADMWYEAVIAQITTALLRRLSASNDILFSDANRSYRPRRGVQLLQSYDVPVSLEFESHSPMGVAVSSFCR